MRKYSNEDPSAHFFYNDTNVFEFVKNAYIQKKLECSTIITTIYPEGRSAYSLEHASLASKC